MILYIFGSFLNTFLFAKHYWACNSWVLVRPPMHEHTWSLLEFASLFIICKHDSSFFKSLQHHKHALLTKPCFRLSGKFSNKYLSRKDAASNQSAALHVKWRTSWNTARGFTDQRFIDAETSLKKIFIDEGTSSNTCCACGQ